MCVYVCICVWALRYECSIGGVKKRVIGSSESRVVGGCDLPHMGVGTGLRPSEEQSAL